jgi:hypothetical protein
VSRALPQDVDDDLVDPMQRDRDVDHAIAVEVARSPLNARSSTSPARNAPAATPASGTRFTAVGGRRGVVISRAAPRRRA